MAQPYMGAPLPGCVTIDSAKNGYLNNARAGNPNAGANGDTATAANNLLGCEKPKAPNYASASLVGHGAPADIDTGSDKGECITIHNEKVWVPLLQPLSGLLNEFYLYGCSVGAGNDGATLLFDIAKVVNTNVYAPTGIIYCRPNGSFYLEQGAVWQVAQPSLTPPKPIPAPTHSLSTDMQNAVLHIAGQATETPVSGLTATYTPQSGGPSRPAIDMAYQVLWDQPHIEDGEPGARITGRLKVNFPNGKSTLTKSFLIHNHSLLRDEAEPTVFYDTTKTFQSLASMA